MAIVAKKETEEKYSHLKKLYSDEKVEKIISKSNKEIVTFKKEEIKIDRKDYIKFSAVIFILGLISLAGFFIQKFL